MLFYCQNEKNYRELFVLFALGAGETASHSLPSCTGKYIV